jgi:uncharacterized membrane protein YcaP (DUF421 family)
LKTNPVSTALERPSNLIRLKHPPAQRLFDAAPLVVFRVGHMQRVALHPHRLSAPISGARKF